MVAQHGEVHGFGCTIHLPKSQLDPGAVIPGCETILDVHIGDHAGRLIRLDIDARLRIRAAGMGEITAINKDVPPADEAEALTEILVEDGVTDGDIVARLGFGPVTDVKAIAAGLIAGDAAGRPIASPFQFPAMAIIAAPPCLP